MSILLRIDGIQVGYGDMTAVHEASLEVRQGETAELWACGPDGARAYQVNVAVRRRT